MNYQVNVNPPPVPGISGPGTVCIGAAASVYSTEPGMTNYNWAVSAGGTITAGANTNQATISWNVTGPQSVSVSYVNSNGCPAATPTTLPIVVNPLPVPVIAGPTSVCAGTTALYTTQPGMTGYQWSISPGGSIVSGGSSASSSMSVLWNEAGPQDVILSYSSGGCQAATPTLLPVNIIARPLPVITGTNVVCSGTSASYHTDEGKSSYVWAVSSGGTIVAGAGTSTIMVLWNTPGQQQVSVNYVSGEGCNAFNPATYAVTVTGIPAAAGTISGLPSVCVNATAVPYSVSPIQNADTYNWTLPLGMTLASGAGTNSIKVNFPGYITTGNLRVSGVNNCFSGPSSPNFQVKTNALLTGQVVLNNMIIGNEQTECLAVQNIILGGEAPFMILAGGQVRLIASDNILFLAGTSVNAGGYLSATITGQCIPCNGSKTPEPTGSYTATANSDISDLPGENQLFWIWPNPTTGIFTIEFKHPEIGKAVTIQIFDVMGKMIQDQKVEAFSKRDFSVAEFPAGIYHLRLIVDNHTEVIRIIKAR